MDRQFVGKKKKKKEKKYEELIWTKKKEYGRGTQMVICGEGKSLVDLNSEITIETLI